MDQTGEYDFNQTIAFIFTTVLTSRAGQSNELLKDMRTAFITGGTGTIGEALVVAFSGAGYSVVFQYGRQAVQASRISAQYSAEAIQLDLATSFAPPDIPVDVLVNCAGINVADSLIHETSIEDWLLTMSVNIHAPFLLTKAYLPRMIEQDWGRIININSIYGLKASEGNGAYNASKHGLTGLTKSIAKDYGQYNITCNQICPGAVDSQLMNRIATRIESDTGQEAKAFLDEVASTYPTGNLVNAQDVCGIALFLASDEARPINGVSIPVDYGLTC